MNEPHGKVLVYEQFARFDGICKIAVTNIVKLHRTGGIDTAITIKRNSNSDNARRKLDDRGEARHIEIACSLAPTRRAFKTAIPSAN